MHKSPKQNLISTPRQLLDKLDILLAPESFNYEKDKTISVDNLISAHIMQIKGIIPFDVMGILLPDDEGIDFDLHNFWPDKSAKSYLEGIIDSHIEGGTFCLALQQNRPIVTYPDAPNMPSQVLHVLTTHQKIMGMFVGVRFKAAQEIDEFSLKLISIILSNCAHGLETHKLNRQISEHNNQLESTIEKRTVQLRAAKEQAEVASRTKSQFLSTMSHELRTPLTAVIGYAETIAQALSSENQTPKELDQIKGQANIIERSAKHLLQIINDILDLSKIESGKLEVEQLAFNPSEVFDEVENVVKLLADEKSLNFSIQYQFPFPNKIKSDPVRLKQILLNLCTNAIKFTEQGAIEIKSHFDQEKQLIVCSVSDQGIGIPIAQQKEIFKPFQQADSSTTRHYGGTGLGLAISTQLTSMLGGHIELRSEPNKGSTFTFSIQSGAMAGDHLVQKYEDLHSLPSQVQLTDVPALRGDIVLAEDWPDNQELIGLYLDKAGITYRIANNGEEALSLVLEKHTDLVLMDIQMPVMGGEECTQMLRDCGYSNPIIALTANVLKEDTERYKQGGFSETLAKPIQQQKFYHTLSRYLPAVSDPPVNTVRQDSEKYKALQRRYIQGLPEQLNQIESAFDERDWKNLAALIHMLKGSGGSFGAQEISDTALEIETSVKSQDIDLCSQQFKMLQQQVHTIISQLH